MYVLFFHHTSSIRRDTQSFIDHILAGNQGLTTGENVFRTLGYDMIVRKRKESRNGAGELWKTY
jgi:hypothetical protein